jgi:hypothetical protein
LVERAALKSTLARLAPSGLALAEAIALTATLDTNVGRYSILVDLYASENDKDSDDDHEQENQDFWRQIEIRLATRQSRVVQVFGTSEIIRNQES